MGLGRRCQNAVRRSFSYCAHCVAILERNAYMFPSSQLPRPLHAMEDELASEARIHELEARIEELQALRQSDRAEVEALRQSETQAHAELEETRTNSELLKQQNSELVQSAKDAQQLRDKTEAEKRELLDALARSDGDKQALEGMIGYKDGVKRC